MKIPLGNFGNVVAEPQRSAQFRDTGQAVGQGIADLGRVVGGIGQEMEQAEVQKQRAQAAMTAAQLSNDAHDAHDTIGREVNDGTLPADQAVPEFKKRLGTIMGERTKGLNPDQRMVIDEHVVRLGGPLERNLQGVAIKRTQQETGANLIGMGEQLQRAAMRDLPGSISQWDSAVDTMAPQAGWGPEQVAKAKQGFKEGATFNFSNAVLEGAAQTGNIDLVRAAREKIEGPEGEAIDPARRTALITKAYGIENGILASDIRAQEKGQREAEARENKAQDALKAAESLMLNGRYFSTEYISELSAVTAGTSAAPAVQEMVKMQKEQAGFASLPLSKQTAIIEQQRQAGSTPGIGVSPEQQKRTDSLERIKDAGQKAYAENPWVAAQERGVIERAPEVQLNDIGTATAVLGARMQQIDTVEAAAERKVSPLQPQEAEQIGRLVRMLPPDQQSSALAKFSTMIADPDRMAAFARQIDSKDPVLGTAMMIGDLQTTQGRYLSELVIKGHRALKDKSITVDTARETGWRGAIAAEIGDAYPNQEVRDRMIEAAFLIQAGLTSEGTSANAKRAVTMAAGEIVVHNGFKVPLPRGMGESDFAKRIEGVTPGVLQAQAPGGMVYAGKQAIPLDQFVKFLPDAALVSAGHGKYNVRSGMGLIVNSKGKRITIEVNNGNR